MVTKASLANLGAFLCLRRARMKSLVVKRSIVIAGHKTSVSLEEPFWRGLKEIAQSQSQTLSDTVAEIDLTRQQGNLSSAIRLFVLDRLRNQPSNYSLDRLDGAKTDKIIPGDAQTSA